MCSAEKFFQLHVAPMEDHVPLASLYLDKDVSFQLLLKFRQTGARRSPWNNFDGIYGKPKGLAHPQAHGHNFPYQEMVTSLL